MLDPDPHLPHSLCISHSTLTVNSITLSRTYTSPFLLHSLPCTISVVMKASHRYKVESVWIVTNVTLRVTPHRNSNPCLPLTQVSFQDPYCISILTSNLNSIFRTLYTQPRLTLPIPYPPAYPNWGFSNPVLDLLIPFLHSRPCIVPHSYRSESPMYCRLSSNID